MSGPSCNVAIWALSVDGLFTSQAYCHGAWNRENCCRSYCTYVPQDQEVRRAAKSLQLTKLRARAMGRTRTKTRIRSPARRQLQQTPARVLPGKLPRSAKARTRRQMAALQSKRIVPRQAKPRRQRPALIRMTASPQRLPRERSAPCGGKTPLSPAKAKRLVMLMLQEMNMAALQRTKMLPSPERATQLQLQTKNILTARKMAELTRNRALAKQLLLLIA